MSDQEKTDNTQDAAATDNTDAGHDHDHDHDHGHDHDHDHDHGHGHHHDHEEAFEFVEEPVFEVEYKGECAYEVKASVAPANEKKQKGELLNKLQEEAELPGFRRGRAPRWLLENKFGKAVRGDATEKLVTAAFQKLIKDQKLKPLQSPDVEGLEEALDRPDDAPLTFTLKFEVAPRCELGKYRGLEVERPVRKVADADIEGVLMRMRERFALYATLADGAAQEGDQVIIDFKGTVDGVEFAGGSAENYPYILGSKRFFPEFEAALVGIKAGGETTCVVNFPGDYSSAQLAGKAADFTIKVSEIKRKEMPALDEEFAKMAGSESVQAMREKVAGDLAKRSEADSQQAAEYHALTKIIEDTSFEMPKSLIEEVSKEYYEQELKRLRELRVPGAEVEKMDEEIRARTREDALRYIKSFVVLNEIGEAEGVEVTDEDFEKEAEAIMTRTGMAMDVVNRYLQQEDQRDEYATRIYRQKAMAVVMEHAVITDKEVSEEELEKEAANASA